ncbi:DUF6223 family protein [Streptomyces sp. NPDC050803]|uniref:DUF6223 family protein n=1 Tax=unclassified Streptomyces TaxID=2593676 RepID=UPI00342C5BFD
MRGAARRLRRPNGRRSHRPGWVLESNVGEPRSPRDGHAHEHTPEQGTTLTMARQTTAAARGLAGLFVARLALARPTSRLNTANGPLGARIAVATGLISVALGGRALSRARQAA